MSDPKVFSFTEIKVGDSASFEIDLDFDFIDKFAELSGDHNPLHVNESYATETEFGNRIPHGMIAGALFSRLIGMELPGKYALYIGQTLSFRRPLPAPGRVCVSGVITNCSAATRTIRIATAVKHAETKMILVEGEALVRVLK